jgi:hypothetical protein
MMVAIKVVLAIVGGCVLGWFLLAGFCNLPEVGGTVSCGHNAFMWLPLFVPAGVLIIWMLISRLARSSRNSRNEGP